MHSNIALTKKMIEYAKRHKLTVPSVSTRTNFWGSGKRTLAWRVSGHLRITHKGINQTANHTAQLDAHFFPMSKAEKAVHIARAELGVHETPYGSNDGERVNYFQSFTGAYNAPWCASFVTSCLVRAGFKLPSFNKAWVFGWHEAARKGLGNIRLINRMTMQPGDVVGLWNDGHVEFFEKWIIRGVSFKCLGGNTSVAGKNNHGGMVCNTTRHTYEISFVARVA